MTLDSWLENFSKAYSELIVSIANVYDVNEEVQSVAYAIITTKLQGLENDVIATALKRSQEVKDGTAVN
jgi:hypothetical protein